MRLAVALDPSNPYKMANGEFVFAIGDPPRPFVVCAFGKPIYAGNFTSSASSMTWPKATIWCTDNYFTSNHVANVGFVINPSPFSQVSPFLPPAANGPDRRADNEIVRALKKLKLTK
jgi:hypothetical protein